MRRIARYSLLYHRSEDILEEFNVETVEKKSAQNKKSWIMLEGWKTSDTPNISLTIDLSEEKKRPGGSLKRLLDEYNREAETGHLLLIKPLPKYLHTTYNKNLWRGGRELWIFYSFQLTDGTNYINKGIFWLCFLLNNKTFQYNKPALHKVV
jgi:hypothetical protein